MSAQIGLSFFHDHRVELPLIGDGFGHHALEHLLPEPRISPHLVEVRALAALLEEPGAQTVERHDEPAGLHGDLQALAQRPVEADQGGRRPRRRASSKKCRAICVLPDPAVP